MKRKQGAIDTRIIYCGDCLDQLPKLPDASVDLVYIDPPFNSNRDYEIFWGETKERRAFDDRHASTKAYIDFMRPRCVELARVLKPTGAFFYHCDWHASHYVKVMLDQILGANLFRSEIVWRRTNAKGLASRGFPNNHDTILYYTGGKDFTFNPQFGELDAKYVDQFYRFKDADGRRYRLSDLTNPNRNRPNLTYEWKGHKRVWRWTKDRMKQADKDGLVHYSSTGLASQKRFLDEMRGRAIDTLWDDIPPVQAQAIERLGYPTQKPLPLLERIISACSDEGDIVLDAFCGCGTALHAAEILKRQWVGIDISPTACRVMAKRLRDECGLQEGEKAWKAGRGFIVRDLPWTTEKLRKIPPFEFENWAVIALGGLPNKAKVGDMGVDGRIYPVSATPPKKGDKTPEFDFMDAWYPIQVKQKDKVGRPDIDAFEAMMIREERTKGFFVSFDYSSDALTEIDRFFRKSGKVIVPFTVKEILDEQIAHKLA
ncbi:MAG TPA: DNA methyltransferase [Candidatus Cybelea sp.]|jgi:site-specific DNA-methyltransferase (adenine-specific)|nr:DNA methyltransferase [Candidatus Cybelea sp.]